MKADLVQQNAVSERHLQILNDFDDAIKAATTHVAKNQAGYVLSHIGHIISLKAKYLETVRVVIV